MTILKNIANKEQKKIVDNLLSQHYYLFEFHSHNAVRKKKEKALALKSVNKDSQNKTKKIQEICVTQEPDCRMEDI